MRRAPHVPTIVVALAAAALGFCTVARAQADEFADFRIPKHTVWNAQATLFGSANRADQADVGSSSSFREGRTSLNFDGSWLRDSDPLLLSLSSSLGATGNRLSSTGNVVGIFPTGEALTSRSQARFRGVGESWLVSAGMRYYPWGIPVGYDFGGLIQGFYVQE